MSIRSVLVVPQKQPPPSLSVKDQSDAKLPGRVMWREQNGLYSSKAVLKLFTALK